MKGRNNKSNTCLYCRNGQVLLSGSVKKAQERLDQIYQFSGKLCREINKNEEKITCFICLYRHMKRLNDFFLWLKNKYDFC